MIENEIKDLLVELKNGQQDMQKQINRIEEQQQKTETNLINKINEATERIDKLEEKQQNSEANLLDKIDKVSLSLARIEADHGEKLGILLDVVTGHIKKFNSVNERVEKCETRLDNHDNKFYILKSAVQSY